MSKIRRQLTIQNHREAVKFFNQLVLDLKKHEMGLEYNPITPERLKEASKHIRDIADCSRPARVYRGAQPADYNV